MNAEQKERRGARRFALHIPLAITRIGDRPAELTGRSHDISTRGICFHTAAELLPGIGLDFILVLPPEITSSDSIHVLCRGKVVRVEREPDGSSLTVAATLESQEFLGGLQGSRGAAKVSG